MKRVHHIPTTAELFVRYRQMVYRTCLRYCRNSAIAEDLCQDVFLQLHEKRNMEQRDDWGAWLYVIAVSRSLDYLRLRRRRAEIVETWKFHFESAEDAPEDLETIKAARDLLESVLAEADESTRPILGLHFVDGIPQGQVAKMLKLSRMTINSKIKSFRKSLKNRILPFFLFTPWLLVSSIVVGVSNGT